MASDDLLQKQMMSDVDDSIRHERLMTFWKEYGPSLIAGIVLAILLTGTISAYRAWHNKVSEKATIELAAALAQQDPAAALAQAAKDLPPAHRAIGVLTVAGNLLQQEKTQEAATVLADAAENQKLAEPYRGLVQIMSIRLAFDQPKSESRATHQWLQTLSKIGNDRKNPWRYHADLQAALVAAHDLEDYGQARKWLAPVVQDENVAPSLKERAMALDGLYAAKAQNKAQKE